MTSKSKIDPVWVRKYRPKHVADVVFTNDNHKANFNRYVERGSFPNLILIGGPGTGKSTISTALCRDTNVHPSDLLTVNCSDSQIDDIRNKVKVFANTMPLGNFKVVQLEEFCGLSPEAQKLLRALIEDTDETTRYIATANYRNKIIPEMFSRLQEYAFVAPAIEEVTDGCMDILDAEGIKYEADILTDLIALTYPDYRKTIQTLEQSSMTGTLILDKLQSEVAAWKYDLLPLIDAGDWYNARQVVCTSASKDELPEMFRFLYQNLSRCDNLGKHEDDVLVLIAEYQYKSNFVADPEIQVAAMFAKIAKLIGKA